MHGARRAREGRDAGHLGLQALPTELVPQTQGPLDGGDELIRLTRLGQELVGDGDHPHQVLLSGVSGEDEASRVGVTPADLGQELPAIGARHSEVRDDEFGRLRLQSLKGGGGTFHEAHVPHLVAGPEHAPQTGEHPRLVIDEEDAVHGTSSSVTAGLTGRRTMKVVPAPGLDSKSMEPP